MRRTVRALFLTLAMATAPIAVTVPVAGASELAEAYNRQTDQDFRLGLQMRLAWAGDYAGHFDGQIGPASLRAIRDFQARHGMEADGIIDEAFLRLLIDVSDEAQESLGVAYVDDAATGVRMVLPLGVVEDFGLTEVGNVWRSADEAIEIETVRIADTGQTLEGLYDVLKEPVAGRSVTSSQLADSWFTVAGTENGRSYYMRFEARDTDLRGFSASYAEDEASRLDPFVVVASNMFDPFAGEPQPPLVASLEPNRNPFDAMVGSGPGATETPRYAMAYADPERPNLFEMPPLPEASDPYAGAPEYAMPEQPEFDMSGTGFVVSDDGWLLTNAHVVRSCKTVLVGDLGAATRTIIDTENDLALIQVDAELAEPLRISAEKPRLGEDILALGFPLRSILADSLNVTRGNVSSLLGLMNDPNYLQISAPVQPGNSGGPLVDLAGRVVGVVTAKLNAVAVADATGDIPQAINFAIRPDAAVSFMKAYDIDFETADPEAELESVPDATAKVKDAILPVLCLGG